MSAHHDDFQSTDLVDSADAISGVSRRGFLGTVGAGAAIASVGLTACVRKPKTPIVPYAKRPEDLLPGVPVYFATTVQEGAQVLGLLVESHDGRPTKIEGNPQHPESGGATTLRTQASVMDLYDLDRSERPLKKGKASDWASALADLDAVGKSIRDVGGDGVALLLPPIMSPTLRRLLTELKAAAPKARFFSGGVTGLDSALAASTAIAGAGAYAQQDLAKAEVVASFDADFLGMHAQSIKHTRAFTNGRRMASPADTMNRLYSVEALFTLTGTLADHRVRATGPKVGQVLKAVATHLGVDAVDAGPPSGLSADQATFANVLATDLQKAGSKAVVMVGDRQPPWVHALGYAINAKLGSAAETWHVDPAMIALEPLSAFASGTFKTVVALETNPAFTSAGDLKLADKLAAVETLVHVGIHADETALLAGLHIPCSHYLEAWGDLQSLSGVMSLTQPLIAPLYHTPSALEVASRLATGEATDGYTLVKATWQDKGDYSEKAWRRWLHNGVIGIQTPAAPTAISFAGAAPLMAAASAPQADGTIVEIHLSPTLLDGRYANNGWLQEMPDPMTKSCWDNAAFINRGDAGKLGVANNDFVTVTVADRSVTLPVRITPGQADGSVHVKLGWGRTSFAADSVASGAGFNTFPLLSADAWFSAGTITKATGSMKVANTQPGFDAYPDSGNRMEPGQGYAKRSLVLESSHSANKANPDWVDQHLDEIMDAKHIGSLIYPEVVFAAKQQWGMAIDLNTCTGCSACVIACQAENNIPTVGKEVVLQGREMHWIRIDRYYTGAEDNPEAVIQPLPCQQCETAPCEAVCPVRATTHSPEGLNDMAYNRCIGTRYCANNCPYKVRKFNYFNFNLDIHPLHQMQKNPDVTIRFRGVIEKCSYCTQRITQARIESKVNGDGFVRDGGIVTACQQVCPAGAIVFGDINDETSKVSELRRSKRDYQLLRDLNTRPRTTYQAKLRNINPDLAPSKGVEDPA